jgi:NADPH:quinone reductase-like Zn-dependent oxidoreductase
VLAATIVDGHIEVREHPDPEPGRGQILVRVHGAGLNGADLVQVRGAYPAPPGWPQDIPGMEMAGEVVATGPAVTRFSPGDRVMAVVGGGAQAELALVHEREAMPVPEGLDWAEAGGLPEVFTTAHDALFTQAGLSMGESLLVHGAAGGVGTAAVQLGVATGARVVATVRDPARRADVESLGATVLDPADAGDHGPYDVILELVGAPNMETNLRSLATGCQPAPGARSTSGCSCSSGPGCTARRCGPAPWRARPPRRAWWRHTYSRCSPRDG